MCAEEGVVEPADEVGLGLPAGAELARVERQERLAGDRPGSRRRRARRAADRRRHVGDRRRRRGARAHVEPAAERRRRRRRVDERARVTVPVTSVKTTSVNIASVVPVRKRLASGYAIAIRRIGASPRMRPRTAAARAQEQVGVEDDHPDGADDDHQAAGDPGREVHRERRRRSPPRRSTGSIRRTTIGEPAPVKASRSETPSGPERAGRGHDRSARCRAQRRGLPRGRPRPPAATPSAEPERRQRSSAGAVPPGRLRQVADGGRDGHAAHAPGRDGDDRSVSSTPSA